jgi:hypothetical protein
LCSLSLQAFLTLAELYSEAPRAEKLQLAKQIMDRFFDPGSIDRLNFEPSQVAACKERYR